MKAGYLVAGICILVFGIIAIGMTGVVGYANSSNNGVNAGYMTCGAVGFILIIIGICLLIYGAVATTPKTYIPSPQPQPIQPQVIIIPQIQYPSQSPLPPSPPPPPIPPPSTIKSNKTCPKCNKEVNPEFSICPYCGEKLIPSVYCTQCGKQLNSEFKVCPFCGTAK